MPKGSRFYVRRHLTAALLPCQLFDPACPIQELLRVLSGGDLIAPQHPSYLFQRFLRQVSGQVHFGGPIKLFLLHPIMAAGHAGYLG